MDGHKEALLSSSKVETDIWKKRINDHIYDFIKNRLPMVNQPHENRKTFLIDRPNRFPTSVTIATKEQETVDSRLTKRVRDW